MARIYIPKETALARALRGWPSSPRVKPELTFDPRWDATLWKLRNYMKWAYSFDQKRLDKPIIDDGNSITYSGNAGTSKRGFFPGTGYFTRASGITASASKYSFIVCFEADADPGDSSYSSIVSDNTNGESAQISWDHVSPAYRAACIVRTINGTWVQASLVGAKAGFNAVIFSWDSGQKFISACNGISKTIQIYSSKDWTGNLIVGAHRTESSFPGKIHFIAPIDGYAISAKEAEVITRHFYDAFQPANQSPFLIGAPAAAATSQYFIPADSPLTRALRGWPSSPKQQPGNIAKPDSFQRCIGGYWGQDITLQNGASFVTTARGRGISLSGVSASTEVARIPLSKIPHSGNVTVFLDFDGGWTGSFKIHIGATAAGSALLLQKTALNGRVQMFAYGHAYAATTATAYTYSTSLQNARVVGRYNAVTPSTLIECRGPLNNSDQDTLTGTYSPPSLDVLSIQVGAATNDIIYRVTVMETLDNPDFWWNDYNRGLQSANQSPFLIGAPAAAATSQYFIPADSPLTRALRGWPSSPLEQPKEPAKANSPKSEVITGFCNEWYRGFGSVPHNAFTSSTVDIVRNSLRSDGSNPGANGIADKSKIEGASTLTVVVRMKFNTLSPRKGVFGHQIAQGFNLNLGYSVYTRLFFYCGSSANYCYEFDLHSGPILAGKYYTFIATFDAGIVSLWVDGIKQSFTWSSIPGTTLPSASYPFDVLTGNYPADGEADLFYIEQRAFSAAEAQFYSRNPFALVEPANQSPFLIGTAAPGPTLIELIIQSATHSHTSANLDLIQANTLVAADTEHSHTSENLDLIQANTLVAADTEHSHTSENLDLTQSLQLVVADTEHSHTSANLDLLQANTLVAADTEHSHTSANLDLLQANTLVAQDTEHGHTVDNVELSQSIQLAIASAEHSHLSDLLALIQASLLVVEDTEHGHTSEGLALTQANTLVTADTEHSHTADNVDLETAGSLGIQDAEHSHTADNVALLQANVLAIFDAAHSHTSENLVLVQANTLAVADTEHSHTAEGITLDVGSILLDVNDALHSHTADNIALTQFNVILVDSATHTHLVDNVSLTEAVELLIADAEHGHTADPVTLSYTQLVEIQDALHGHFSDNLDLSAQITLVISDTVHAHLVGNIILPGTFLSSGRLMVVNSIGDRIVYIAGSDRIVYVMKEE